MKRKNNEFFSKKIKKQLWENNSEHICAICKGKIWNFEDYEPDHIIPVAKGGTSTYENAQLSHRKCNRKKGKMQ
ncbi:MAG: HNH endonuclease [Mycoplasmataceae bacterium]|jgi:5-methylcytosine-specific restriction endonuclease McrA|nr:HNH endonuclease [Mycoplasmataceae bacterium]